jgi:cysteine desulfurase
MKILYFDNAAGTPIASEVLKAMGEFDAKFFANPNSLHLLGQESRVYLDNSRKIIADFIHAQSNELIFTSGATEANNLAIKGIIEPFCKKGRSVPHVIISQFEHDSVYNIVKKLESQKIIEVTYIAPAVNKTIQIQDVVKAIRKNTVLVSIIFISNEIGATTDIRSLGKYLYNLRRKIYFHTDATQAIKYHNCNVQKLGVDLMSFSAHKISGPKGIGALYIKSGTPIASQIIGGSQENGFRAGTQNVTGAVGFAKAVQLLGSLENREKNSKKVLKYKNLILAELTKYKKIIINSLSGESFAPDIVSFSIKNQDQERLLYQFDRLGICVSSGSACRSGAVVPSHIIRALYPKIDRIATIRVTLSKYTTSQEVANLIRAIKKIL